MSYQISDFGIGLMFQPFSKDYFLKKKIIYLVNLINKTSKPAVKKKILFFKI